MRAIGADTPVLGGDAVSELEAQATEFAGVRYIAFFQASRVRTPEAKAFVSAFMKKYGVPPEQRSALAYDATMLIGRARARSRSDAASGFAITSSSIGDVATAGHRRHRLDLVRRTT